MLHKLEYELTEADIEYMRFHIKKGYLGFFPPCGEPFLLDLKTNQDIITTNVRRSTHRIGKGLRPWFRRHSGELNEGGKVLFTVIDPMKEYRLKILKERKAVV